MDVYLKKQTWDCKRYLLSSLTRSIYGTSFNLATRNLKQSCELHNNVVNLRNDDGYNVTYLFKKGISMGESAKTIGTLGVSKEPGKKNLLRLNGYTNDSCMV